MTKNYNLDSTCALSGNRQLAKDFDIEKLKSTLESLIQSGYDTFLNGMAIGFDSVCFSVLHSLRKKYKIKIIACIPCKNQNYKYTEEQNNVYKKMLTEADECILVSENYTKGCMQKRNMFMVDNCSALVVYQRKSIGGTKNTIEYAKRMGKVIIFI